mmetsp:Transcript_31537/g.46202  ORF Transcript_31537/g.46202 Transcript_31537/m.46202 type:complete len:661 (+) Transcript_31537:94-2076(+)
MAESTDGSDSELKCSVFGSRNVSSSASASSLVDVDEDVTLVRRLSKSSMTDVSLSTLFVGESKTKNNQHMTSGAGDAVPENGSVDFLSGDVGMKGGEGVNELEAELRRRRARNVGGAISDLEASVGAKSYPSDGEGDDDAEPDEWLKIQNTAEKMNLGVSFSAVTGGDAENGDVNNGELKHRRRASKLLRRASRFSMVIRRTDEDGDGEINFWPFQAFGIFGRPPKDENFQPATSYERKFLAYTLAFFLFTTLIVMSHFIYIAPLLERNVSNKANFEKDLCIQNGYFRGNPPNTDHWYAIGGHLELKQKNFAIPDSALLATGRTSPPQQVSGMYQNVPANCFTPSKWYTVHARVLLRSAFEGQPFYCDPTILWGNNVKSCPTVNIKMLNGPAQEIAWTMGRNLDEHIAREDEGWMNLEGAFQYPTSNEMKGEGAVDVISVTRAPLGVDILLDYVYIEPMQDAQSVESFGMRTCETNLIANGDAETGDHRFWFIRGNGGEGGHIEVHHTERGYAFRHAGYRSERWRGMLQSLDATCITPHSTWRISAMFRYFVTNEHGIDVPQVCDKSNPMAPDSCPVFELQFVSLKHTSTDNGAGNMALNTGPMVNEDTEEFVLGDWNRIVHTITVSEDMAMQSEVWLYVQSVAKGFNYELDDVEMLPLV